MTTTLKMIRRIREIQSARVDTGVPTLWDIKLGRMLIYLRHRHHRDTGHLSPI